MTRIAVHATVADKILVSRESARRLEEPLRQATATAGHGSGLVVDFAGVEGMAPAFLDELLGVLHDAVGGRTRIRVLNQPARLSLKFEAIAKGRGLQVTEEARGVWVFADAAPPKTDRAI